MVFGSLAVGGATLMTLRSLKPAGIWFFRTLGLVFLGVALLSVAFSPYGFALIPGHSANTPLSFFVFVLLLFVYNLRLWFHPPHASKPLLWTAAPFGFWAIVSTVTSYLSPETSILQTGFFSLYAITSSFLLGCGVLGMLLGHRYLTNPSLSIVPLVQASRMFMICVWIEGGMVVLQLISVHQSLRVQNAFLLSSFEGLYLWIRLLVGLVGPLILAPMILATARERATMSATGLFYIAMLMVIIGEIFSRFFLLMDSLFL